jgi:hypothetical protein
MIMLSAALLTFTIGTYKVLMEKEIKHKAKRITDNIKEPKINELRTYLNLISKEIKKKDPDLSLLQDNTDNISDGMSDLFSIITRYRLDKLVLVVSALYIIAIIFFGINDFAPPIPTTPEPIHLNGIGYFILMFAAYQTIRILRLWHEIIT